MYVSRAAALAAAVLLASPAAADTFKAQNRLTVVPLNGSDFEVLGPAELFARDFWCAAADYGQRRLGLATSDRLQVTEAYGPSQTAAPRKSVRFAPGAGSDGQGSPLILTQTVRNVGSDLSVGHAISYCADYKLRSSGR